MTELPGLSPADVVTSKRVTSFYPRFSIHWKFLHCFEQTICVCVGDAAGEIVLAIIPFLPATVASRARNVW
jgi:hypothetical protein